MKSKIYCFKVEAQNNLDQEMNKVSNDPNNIGYRTIARRISRACDECRKRKTRCLAEGNACQLCNSRNKLCTYEAPSFKRGPKPKKPSLINIGEQQFKVEQNKSQYLHLSLPSPPSSFQVDLGSGLSSSVTPSSEMITPLLNGDGKEISNYIQRLYNNGTIVCLTPSQVNIVLNYFYFLHDQNLLIDYNRFIMFLTSPMYTTSFKFLLNCLFIVTTKNLPHLQEEYINLYSTDIIAKELENLTCIMNSFFNNERELDLMMNRELGLSLMNLTFN